MPAISDDKQRGSGQIRWGRQVPYSINHNTAGVRVRTRTQAGAISLNHSSNVLGK